MKNMKLIKRKLSALLLILAIMLSVAFVTPMQTVVDNAASFTNLSAHELVADMGTGWNLGNTFDSYQDGNPVGFPWLGDGTYASLSPTELETAWLGGMKNVTTQSLIKAVRLQGFDTIRIPVTWHKVTTGAPEWTIRSDWMARVKAVVDWAVEEDMYIILNSHHDESAFNLRDSGIEESKNFMTRIWTQIADTFKDYNEKLIFEGLNEPRTKDERCSHKNSVCTENRCHQVEWNWGTGTPVEYIRNLNLLHQAFVDAVRATGGNNVGRILMVSTYGAGITDSALRELRIPNDNANVVNKIALSVHTYSPFIWAHDGVGTYEGAGGVNKIRQDLDLVETYADKWGVPVILGEWGSVASAQTAEDRARHAEDYVYEAKKRGMVSVWWDNGSTNTSGHDNLTLIERAAPHVVRHPAIIQGIMRGIGAPLPPTPCENGHIPSTANCTRCRMCVTARLTESCTLTVLCTLHSPPVTLTPVPVQLMAMDTTDSWPTTAGETVYITGNGTFTAEVSFINSPVQFPLLAINAEGANFNNNASAVHNATPAPPEFKNAVVSLDSITFNGNEFTLTDNKNLRLVSDYGFRNGYADVEIWNAWWEPHRRISDAPTAVMGDSDPYVVLSFPNAVQTIKVSFTVSGVDEPCRNSCRQKSCIGSPPCGITYGARGNGKVMGNTSVSVSDALEILKYIVGMDGKLLNGSGTPAWDAALIVNNFGRPAVRDALEILKHLVGMDSLIKR